MEISELPSVLYHQSLNLHQPFSAGTSRKFTVSTRICRCGRCGGCGGCGGCLHAYNDDNIDGRA